MNSILGSVVPLASLHLSVTPDCTLKTTSMTVFLVLKAIRLIDRWRILQDNFSFFLDSNTSLSYGKIVKVLSGQFERVLCRVFAKCAYFTTR